MSNLADIEIVSEIQNAIVAAVAASNTPDIPVKYLNLHFDPPNDGKWLEIVWLPANEGNEFWGDQRNYSGSFRLILHWPNDNVGISVPLAVIGSIASYFTKALRLPTVKIHGKPTSAGALENGAETLYPVTVRYGSFRA